MQEWEYPGFCLISGFFIAQIYPTLLIVHFYTRSKNFSDLLQGFNENSISWLKVIKIYLQLIHWHFWWHHSSLPITSHISVSAHQTLTYPQICKGDPRACAILIPAWGSNWGYSGFSHNQNNHGSSGVYVTCIYCGLRVKINMCWNAARCAKFMDAFVLRLFLRVWSAKTWIPPIWVPWLTTSLHRVVYQVWDLSCTSVGTSPNLDLPES